MGRAGSHALPSTDHVSNGECCAMMIINPFRFVLACCFLPARNGLVQEILRRRSVY